MLKKILIKLKLLFSNPYTQPKIYRDYFNVKIGDKARFTGKINFGSEPYLVSIGDHVTLAHNVTFHTHDGGVWLFRDEFPGINIYGKISIGNNVFIGSNVIILPNVKIGNNVIVGAGSIVTKSLKSDAVYAGNPAKYIKSINEYKEKSLQNALFLKSNKKNEKVIKEHLLEDKNNDF